MSEALEGRRRDVTLLDVGGPERALVDVGGPEMALLNIP